MRFVSQLFSTFTDVLVSSSRGRAGLSLLMGLALLGIGEVPVQALQPTPMERLTEEQSDRALWEETPAVREDRDLSSQAQEEQGRGLQISKPTDTEANLVTRVGIDITKTTSSSISIADVDRDGHPDLLITGCNENRNPTTALYLRNGDGTFEETGAS